MSNSVSNSLVGSICLSCFAIGLTGHAALEESKQHAQIDGPAVSPQESVVASHKISRAAVRAIRTSLQTKVSVEFSETALIDALTFLAGKAKVPLYVDDMGLGEEGIASDEPISLKLADATIRQVLDLTLPRLGLTWVIQDEVLKVTTEIRADEVLETVSYDVSGLMQIPDPYGENGGSRIDDADLIRAIMAQTTGAWIESDGAGGTLKILNDVLIVRQTYKTHVEVAALIRALQTCLHHELPGKSVAVNPPGHPIAAESKLRAALRHRVSVDYVDTPLVDAAEALSRAHGVTILLDDQSLNEEGIAADEPLNIELKNVTLASALKLMLEPLGCTVVIRNGVLQLTTEIHAQELVYAMIHDVRDLVAAGHATSDLEDLLRSCTSGPWLEDQGEGGNLVAFHQGMLLVLQTDKVHQESLILLHDVRRRIGEIRKTKEDTGTAGTAPESVETRFYPTLDHDRAKALAESLESLVAPDTWKDRGGTGLVQVVDETLVVKQSVRVHREIKSFIDRLRAAEQEAIANGGF